MAAEDSRTLDLRRGDKVRLRPLEEIATTLDAEGRTDALPFMVEMLALRGTTMQVHSRTDKTCDTIEGSGCTRRMTDTVHLEGARCDGSAHGGCQAYCLLFFKEQWLERVADDQRPAPLVEEPDGSVRSVLEAYADAGPDTYRCQATQLLEASEHLGGRGHYVTDIRTRNVPLGRVVKAITFQALNRYQVLSKARLPQALQYRKGGMVPSIEGRVRDGAWPAGPSELQAGDLVEVRSKSEIEATLDADQRNRGLWYDRELLHLCGQRARILFKVERLIDERTGRMLRIRKDLFVISGPGGCVGTYNRLCTRSIVGMMRGAWLRKLG